MDLSLPPALTNAPLAFTADHELVATGALFNLPAVVLILLLTWICYVGIRESSLANAAMAIVRASCRARVWQYVSISVSAVSLIKKTHTSIGYCTISVTSKML